MKNYIGIIILVCIILIFPPKILAESDYVLPYPSFMPGSKLYILQEIKNSAMKHWYFGNFGQFTYNLKQSDKFLVEAKTLFEYKQYLLADKALKKSNYFFKQTSLYLEKADQENKNISQKKKILRNSSAKHIEILIKLQKELPDNFIWRPEKSSATELNLRQEIQQAIKTREKTL